MHNAGLASIELSTTPLDAPRNIHDLSSRTKVQVERRIAQDYYYHGGPNIFASSAAVYVLKYVTRSLPDRAARKQLVAFALKCYDDEAKAFRLRPDVLRKYDFFYLRSALSVLKNCGTMNDPAKNLLDTLGKQRVDGIRESVQTRLHHALRSDVRTEPISDIFYALKILPDLGAPSQIDSKTAKRLESYLVRCGRSDEEDSECFAYYLSPDSEENCISSAYYAHRIAAMAGVNISAIRKGLLNYVCQCFSVETGGFWLTPHSKELYAPNLIPTYFASHILERKDIINLEIDVTKIVEFILSCRVQNGFAFHPTETKPNVFACHFALQCLKRFTRAIPAECTEGMGDFVQSLYDSDEGAFRARIPDPGEYDGSNAETQSPRTIARRKTEPDQGEGLAAPGYLIITRSAKDRPGRGEIAKIVTISNDCDSRHDLVIALNKKMTELRGDYPLNRFAIAKEYSSDFPSHSPETRFLSKNKPDSFSARQILTQHS